MQIGNGFRLAVSNPMRVMGAPSAGVVCREQWSQSGALRNWYAGEATSGNELAQASSRPSGYYPPATWLLAPRAGALRAHDTIAGSATCTASIAAGRNLEAAIAAVATCAASIAALGILSVSIAGGSTCAASITGAVNLSTTIAGAATCSASIAGAVSLSTSIAGTSTCAASISGALEASASLAGTSTCAASITGAVNLSTSIAGVATCSGAVAGIWSMVASIAGTSTCAASVSAPGHLTTSIVATATAAAAIHALAHLTATLEVGGSSDPLSPSSLAAAVWSAAAASYVAAGTTGAALTLIRQILQGRTVTDPSTGRITVYDDAGAVLLEADLWQDAAGTIPYAGAGAERRDRLE